jgi:hypothetical protein
MDQQEAVHTPFEDIKNVASELLERLLFFLKLNLKIVLTLY